MRAFRICINPEGEFGPDQSASLAVFQYDNNGDPYRISTAELLRQLHEEPQPTTIETAIGDGNNSTIHETSGLMLST